MTERLHDETAGAPRDDGHWLFSGAGEMRGRGAAFDWSQSPLGPVRSWPQSLRTTVATVLDCGFPAVLLWGAELIQIYNDRYREVMGTKHPFGFGIPTQECWPEAWGFNEPIYARVFGGETVYFEDVLIPIVRYGSLEDVYFTISYSPVRGERGAIDGVLVTLLETTARVAARVLEAEREKLLAQVQVERNRLGEVFEQAPSFFAVLRGSDHVFELANDAYHQLVGHRDVVGKPVAEALPEVRSQGFIELLDQVLATGIPFVGRAVPVMLTRSPGASAEERMVDFVYQRLADADGTPSGIVVHGVDVTEQALARRDVERLLRESEQARHEIDVANARLRDVFDQAPMAVAVLSGPDHVYTVASPTYSRFLGGRALVGRAFREAVPEPGGQAVAELMDRVYETGVPIAVKEQIVPLDRDGDGVVEEYIFDISYQPLRNSEGAVYAITSLSLDVTDQVRARIQGERATRAIAHAQQQLERVFSEAPVAIAVLDGPTHRFVLANPRYQELVGRTELVGYTVQEAFPELASQGIYELLDRVYQTGEPFIANELAVKLRRRAGAEPEDASLNFTYQPLHAADGTVYGIGVVAVDVTDQVRSREAVERLLRESEESRGALELANTQLEEQQIEMELTNQQLQDNATELEAQTEELAVQAQELEEQSRLAHEANRAKSEFLATMSHELRTPLNAIGGYADLLLAGVRGELADSQRMDVERMKRSGHHLLTLINNILNFAKLDAGEVEFRTTVVSAASLLDGLEDLIAPQVASKSLHLTFDACDPKALVHADADKVRQVLLNLLSNAVKFTNAGGEIALTSECTEEWVRITVRDTGRGIHPAQMSRIFDPFVQVDRHLTPASQQGVGLGLAISRDLARGMGGELSATSAPGEGSAFTLSLRRA